MFSGSVRKPALRLTAAALLVLTAGSAQSLETLDFSVKGPKDLEAVLRAGSVLLASKKDGKSAAEDVFADARAEYGNLLNVLYARGHYSAVIHVYVDGIEAAEIAPLDAPVAITAVKVVVDAGPAFRLAKAKIGPLAPGTELPKGFVQGAVAESGVIVQAAAAGVNGWRAQGHAKALVVGQDLTADHPAALLSADIALQAGPKLRFGRLKIEGIERMREGRVRAIAGLPEGEVFQPEDLERALRRLRRTGVFKSAVLTEDEQVTAPDLLGITANLVEEKRRRYTFGAEIATQTGLTLTGEWLHRNLFGGAERLTLHGSVENIGQSADPPDLTFGAAIARPATFDADTTLTGTVDFGRLYNANFQADTFATTVGLDRIFSNSLTGSVSLGYDVSRVRDASGDSTFRALTLPIGLVWDRRDSKTDPTRNIYMAAEVKPFLGFGATDNGTRAKLDMRGYKAVGAESRLVLAARIQAGEVFGSSLQGTPRTYLFYSGGGGTVRGQPFESLGVPVNYSGGKAFVGGSLEARFKLSESLGVVGFFDAGRVDATRFFHDGNWHSGAGIGIRYATPVGPIRLDLAGPVGGTTGSGMQIYLGLGQAF